LLTIGRLPRPRRISRLPAFVNAPAPAAPPHAAIEALVVGDGELAGALVEELRARGARCTHLRRPNDRALAGELARRPGFVAVISHDDIHALRLALVAEHAYPGVSLLVTIFDATVAAQLVRHVPNCRVVSLADAAAPVLAADCMRAARPVGRAAARWAMATSQLRPYDASSRLLVGGVAGLALILVAETIVGWAGFGHPLATAFYESAKATATVGPDAVAEESGRAYAVAAGAAMLLATALTAAATAGLINRLMTRRLVALVGRRTLPRRDHVLVIGLGQVGLRLAMMLQHQGVRVVAIERDRHAPNVHLAKRLGIPVMVGDGTERGLLIRLGVRRAAALASVTSDDHVNIAVSVAALAVREDLRGVLRAGDDDAVTETRALFPIGVVRDVNRLAAGHFAELAVAGAA
jgi:voltage-gated potassium channel Kch